MQKTMHEFKKAHDHLMEVIRRPHTTEELKEAVAAAEAAAEAMCQTTLQKETN